MKVTLGAFLAFYAIVAIRYLVVSAGFDLYLRRYGFGFRRIEPRVNGVEKRGYEIRASLISSLGFALSGILLAEWMQTGRARVYWDSDWKSLASIPLGIGVYLVIHDAWFYFTHRLLHRKWFFKHVHAVHHASVRPTAYAALSFHWSEALLESSFLPMMVLFVPIHGFGLLAFLVLMTFFGTINHSAHEFFPRGTARSKWGRWILTPTHHTQHHERFTGNYSLYFTWWDRLLGTQFPDYEDRFDLVSNKTE